MAPFHCTLDSTNTSEHTCANMSLTITFYTTPQSCESTTPSITYEQLPDPNDCDYSSLKAQHNHNLPFSSLTLDYAPSDPSLPCQAFDVTLPSMLMSSSLLAPSGTLTLLIPRQKSSVDAAAAAAPSPIAPSSVHTSLLLAGLRIQSESRSGSRLSITGQVPSNVLPSSSSSVSRFSAAPLPVPPAPQKVSLLDMSDDIPFGEDDLLAGAPPPPNPSAKS